MKKIFLISVVVIQATMFCVSQYGYAGEVKLDELRSQAFKFYKKKYYEKSINVTMAALEMASAEFGEDSVEAAEFMGNLGVLYQYIGEEGRGRELLNKAKKIRAVRGEAGTPLGIQVEVAYEQMVRNDYRSRDFKKGIFLLSIALVATIRLLCKISTDVRNKSGHFLN